MAVTWRKLAYEGDVITKAILTAAGDIIYADGAESPAVLAKGADNEVLTLVAGIPSWAASGTPVSHASTHLPAGDDPLTTAAPLEITGVQASAVGTAESFVKSDHAHQIQESFADDHIVTINSTTVAENDMARFTVTGGIEGRTYAELAGDIALDDIGVPDAPVDFDLQQATDLVIMTVADEASLPITNIAVGQPCWTTATLALHMCTSIT